LVGCTAKDDREEGDEEDEDILEKSNGQEENCRKERISLGHIEHDFLSIALSLSNLKS